MQHQVCNCNHTELFTIQTAVDIVSHTQLYSPLEKAAQLYAKK